MSGKPGSTVPVGYGSTSNSGPTVSGWAPPWIELRSGLKYTPHGSLVISAAGVVAQRLV